VPRDYNAPPILSQGAVSLMLAQSGNVPFMQS
jgi:hypothetical protein